MCTSSDYGTNIQETSSSIVTVFHSFICKHLAVPKMTYNVFSGMLNPTHSLTANIWSSLCTCLTALISFGDDNGNQTVPQCFLLLLIAVPVKDIRFSQLFVVNCRYLCLILFMVALCNWADHIYFLSSSFHLLQNFAVLANIMTIKWSNLISNGNRLTNSLLHSRQTDEHAFNYSLRLWILAENPAGLDINRGYTRSFQRYADTGLNLGASIVDMVNMTKFVGL